MTNRKDSLMRSVEMEVFDPTRTPLPLDYNCADEQPQWEIILIVRWRSHYANGPKNTSGPKEIQSLHENLQILDYGVSTVHGTDYWQIPSTYLVYTDKVTAINVYFYLNNNII